MVLEGCGRFLGSFVRKGYVCDRGLGWVCWRFYFVLLETDWIRRGA